MSSPNIEAELSANLLSLLQLGIRADVPIRAGEEMVRGHSAILIARSKVFADALSGAWSPGDPVNLGPHKPQDVRDVLRYLYGGRLPAKTVVSLDLARSARALGAERLADEMEDRVAKAASPTQLVGYLKEGANRITESLHAKLVAAASARATEVSRAEGFRELPVSLLADIVAAMASSSKKRHRERDIRVSSMRRVIDDDEEEEDEDFVDDEAEDVGDEEEEDEEEEEEEEEEEDDDEENLEDC
jgi:hypothetical protein